MRSEQREKPQYCGFSDIVLPHTLQITAIRCVSTLDFCIIVPRRCDDVARKDGLAAPEKFLQQNAGKKPKRAEKAKRHYPGAKT